MDDLISRQAVLELIANYDLSMGQVVRGIHSLKSVNLQEPKTDTLDKIKGYIDHIRNTGMGKKKSLEFIEKFIEGLKAEMQ